MAEALLPRYGLLMSWTMWVLAVVTVLVNVPSIAKYARDQLPYTSPVSVTRGALWYVVSRSSALILSTVAAVIAALAGLGTQWLFAIAVATALVQLIDVPVAATTGDVRGRRNLTILTLVALLVEVAMIVVSLTIPVPGS